MVKKKIDFGFTPSEYQEKIFDFVQHGVGNAVISATAGSGKTSTIVSAIKLIPTKKKCLFIAFNKSIVDELSKKLESCKNVMVRTSHSLGFLMLKRNIGGEFDIDEYKYRTYVKNHITELSTADGTKMTRAEVDDYVESICSLIDYSRFNIAQSVKEIENVANKYDIPVSYDECEVALKCLEWGKNNLSTIDYTDMVWLPYELSLKPIGLQFDWIMIDECQDLSLLSIQLFLRCFKRGTRFVAVGDKNQSIYAFSGASEDAFDFMCNYQNTEVFNLPISYRCDKNIVRLSNEYVADMKYREDAGEGEILYDVKIKDIKDGDMVLSRTKSPLLALYIKLLRKGVNCYIKGNDIGLSLIKTLESIDKEELNQNLNNDGVFVRLYERLFDERNKLIDKRGLDYDDATLSSYIMSLYDSINALEILSEKINSKTKLISNIKKIFSDDSNGVCLSTIHKAKGLECKNVYIVCRSSMPSKLVSHDWERQQEDNLIYVAYTRAKNKLGFISEKEVSPSGSAMESTAILSDLKYIENKISTITNKIPREQMGTAEMAKFKLKNATVIKDAHLNDNCHELKKKDKGTKESKITKDNKDMLSELKNLLNSNKNSDAIELIKKMGRS